MSAFISHSSADTAVARDVEAALSQHGIEAWLDRSDLEAGPLLSDTLLGAIRGSRVLVLLWSKAAARSRWVAAELLSAFHMNRFIVPCSVGKAPLPFFLQRSTSLRVEAGSADWIDALVRSVAKAPRSANRLPGILRSPSGDLLKAVKDIADAQSRVLDRLGDRQVPKALALQARAGARLDTALPVWRLEPMVLNLAGYDAKNRYLLRHWDAIQAGRPPKDRLLRKAERYFFEALFADPNDCSALNGLGSILTFERDLDAARFFIRRAIVLAKREGLDYREAKQDLAMISRAR
jgi:tetratricopeptide (TPR) repeat protein